MNKTFLKTFFSLRNQLLFSASFTTLNNSQVECQAGQRRKTNYFNFASAVIPHPAKVEKGGEDALFANDKILVVADGVGGWADLGIDPGLYSKELCQHMGNLIKSDQPTYIVNPKQLIIKAHRLNKQVGSTTVCVVTIDDHQLLVRSSFVGDSGYAIFRKNMEDKFEIIFKSQEQQKGFNFPYQIGSEGDNPECAITDQHTILDKDIFVLGTDGLYDNLNASQVKTIIEEEYRREKNINLQKIARSIAEYAYKLSLDETYASPFQRNAKQHGLSFQGGKSDDITVVVAQVCEKAL